MRTRSIQRAVVYGMWLYVLCFGCGGGRLADRNNGDQTVSSVPDAGRLWYTYIHSTHASSPPHVARSTVVARPYSAYSTPAAQSSSVCSHAHPPTVRAGPVLWEEDASRGACAGMDPSCMRQRWAWEVLWRLGQQGPSLLAATRRSDELADARIAKVPKHRHPGPTTGRRCISARYRAKSPSGLSDLFSA